jgi:hypothetical protein
LRNSICLFLRQGSDPGKMVDKLILHACWCEPAR